jgi:hypothetical protein
MSRWTALAVLHAVLAAALAACGGEPIPTTPAPGAPSARTFYVRAEGMVKKLGIT